MPIMLAFLACVERGNLENQTKLLCRSIRRYAGQYRHAPIHTFQPRHGTEISAETLVVLNELGVVHHTARLNTAYPDYGVGNKVFVCAWAEANLREDVLVFLDSDTIMIGEPTDLDLPAGIDAAVRPADSLPLNSTGPGDPMDGYWRQMYAICGLENEPFVETELGRRVRAYFSAGLIAVRRSAGLFRQWEADFRRLVQLGHLPEATGMSRMDEVALAATLVRVFERLRLLDGRYNYLIYRRHRLKSPWREAALAQLVHVHYRTFFNKPDFLRSLQPPLDPTEEIVRWLDQYLPFEPITYAPQPG